MDIEVLELKERSMKFVLRNSTPALANALRRTIISDIPKLAIDEVEFIHGTVVGVDADSKTPLFDEIIAHRLGQIPLPTVDGVEKAKYFLSKVGPCTVFSGDLEVWDEATGKLDEELAPIDKKIPIVELAAKQSIMLNAFAVLGTAKKHAKWQVANAVGYKYRPIVEVKEDVKNPEEIANNCPKKVFAVEGGKLVVKNEIACSLCMTCVEESKKGAITVKGDESTFIFTFETDGSLTAQQVLDKAVDLLASEAKVIADKVAAF